MTSPDNAVPPPDAERPTLAVTYDSMSSAPMELAALLGGLCDIV